jgi:hypothetical protein
LCLTLLRRCRRRDEQQYRCPKNAGVTISDARPFIVCVPACWMPVCLLLICELHVTPSPHIRIKLRINSSVFSAPSRWKPNPGSAIPRLQICDALNVSKPMAVRNRLSADAAQATGHVQFDAFNRRHRVPTPARPVRAGFASRQCDIFADQRLHGSVTRRMPNYFSCYRTVLEQTGAGLILILPRGRLP